MTKYWEDKSQRLSYCPVCYCSVTHQLRDYHILYHENKTAISEIGEERKIPVNYVDTLNDIIET